ncbi:MAG: hypothetical protein HQK91_10465 [Nitrospirae bacterium]|nr:hypothetical protein [Nitrospirota bacterium]MBF0541857.1 hypothetical protein [Nitrospirota bacterium]
MATKDSLDKIKEAVQNTEQIEKALDGFLCPMQMFLELNREKWNTDAVKMLAHDLNAKRIFITKVSLNYLEGIDDVLKEIMQVK